MPNINTTHCEPTISTGSEKINRGIYPIYIGLHSSGGSSYRDMGIIPTNKFKWIFCFYFVFKILSLLLLTVLNFVIVLLHDAFS